MLSNWNLANGSHNGYASAAFVAEFHCYKFPNRDLLIILSCGLLKPRHDASINDVICRCPSILTIKDLFCVSNWSNQKAGSIDLSSSVFVILSDLIRVVYFPSWTP